MNASMYGWVVDQASGVRITAPDVRLNPIGVPGEVCAAVGERGGFSFHELAPGQYSLTAFADEYVPHHQSLDLDEGEILQNFAISLTRGGRISGRFLDEAGLPPKRCRFTLLREGQRNGRSGYLLNSGDHEVEKDGTFCSPPLTAGTYLVRLAGFLQTISHPSEHSGSSQNFIQQRVFDFIYPDAHDVRDARQIQLKAGQEISGLEITIPIPRWYTVRGKVTGPLPEDHKRISVMFARDIGALDQIGGSSGVPVQPDGLFEMMLQQGRYTAEICEFSPPEPDGFTRVVRRLGAGVITVENQDLVGVEIEATDSETERRQA